MLRMRVAFIAEADNTETYNRVNFLVSRGVSVTLFTLSEHAHSLYSYPREVVIATLDYEAPSAYKKATKKLYKMLKGGRFDIAVASGLSEYGQLISRVRFSPAVLIIKHQDLIMDKLSPLKKRSLIKRLNGFDAVITHGEFAKAKTAKLFKKKDRIYNIATGIDTELFFCKREQNISTSLVIGAMFGNSEEAYESDIIDLLKGFSSACHTLKNYSLSLHICGKKELPLAKRWRSQLSLFENLNYTPYIKHDQLPGVINSFDICLLLGDFTDVQAAEVMSCGVPLIVPDTQGLCEAVENHFSGIIAESRQPKDICKAICYLASNKSTREDLANSAMKRARKSYDHHHNIDQLIELLRSLVTRKKKSNKEKRVPR